MSKIGPKTTRGFLRALAPAVLVAAGTLMAASPSASTTPGTGTSSAVHERTLDNGLKVLVKRDDRAPIVTSQVWYKVGSSYEYGGSRNSTPGLT